MTDGETSLYYAYGSNLSVARLRARIPEAEVVCVASLPQYRLAFHKRSLKDGSGKCDAFHTGREADLLLGVVYSIPASAWPGLDEIEGRGYERRTLDVLGPDGRALTVQTYIGILLQDDLRPMDWYRQHVLVGAHEHGFPPAYLEYIESVPVQQDTDTVRAAREFAVHTSAAGSRIDA